MRREARLLDDARSSRFVHAFDGVDAHEREGFRPGRGHLLDIHSALDTRHGEERAIRAVEEEGDVVLLGDVGGLGDEDTAYDVPLDVESEDVVGARLGLVGGGRELDASGLATAARLDLRLHHHGGADLARGLVGCVGRGTHFPGGDRDSMRVEEVLGLVLVKVHGSLRLRPAGLRLREPTDQAS